MFLNTVHCEVRSNLALRKALIPRDCLTCVRNDGLVCCRYGYQSLDAKGHVPEATRTTEVFYRHVQQRQYNSTRYLLGKKILADMLADSFVNMLKKLSMLHGDGQSYELTHNRYSKDLKNAEMAINLVQEYKVIYTAGLTTKERFRFIVSDSDLVKIDAYDVDLYEEQLTCTIRKYMQRRICHSITNDISRAYSYKMLSYVGINKSAKFLFVSISIGKCTVNKNLYRIA